MAASTPLHSDCVYDATPEFVYAVSLLASLEDSTGQVGHALVLPLLGLARAELVDFGQRRPDQFVEIEESTLGAGLIDLDARLSALLSDSEVLQQTVRLEAARRYVRRALEGDMTGEGEVPDLRQGRMKPHVRLRTYGSIRIRRRD